MDGRVLLIGQAQTVRLFILSLKKVGEAQRKACSPLYLASVSKQYLCGQQVSKVQFRFCACMQERGGVLIS